MKVYVNGILYDALDTPIAVIFDDDNERINAGMNIANMDFREGPRAYICHNTTMREAGNFCDRAMEAVRSGELAPEVNEWRTFVIAKCKKEVQDIKLADGSIHLQCWPNAGYFIHLIDGRAKDVPQTEVIETRKCKIQLFGYEQKK